MATPATARSLFARTSGHQLFMVALAVVCALVVGASIGKELWPVVAALVALPVVIWWPVQCALGAFAVLVLFEPTALADSGGGKAIGFFVGAAATGILLATAVIGRRLQTPPRAAMWWTLAVVWAGLTGFWALDPQIVIGRVPTAFALLILYLAAVSLRVEEREFRPVVALIILAGLLAGAYSCYQYSQGLGHHVFGPLRGSLVIAGSVVNPDLFATRLMLPLALTVSTFFIATSWLKKTLMLGVGGVMLLAILLTQSRAALLGLIIMTAVFLFRLGVNPRILAVCGAFAMVVMFLPSQLFTRVSEAAGTGGAGRVSIWQVGLELVKHYGIFGAGLSKFPAAYANYAGYATVFKGFDNGAHNLYLQITVECGVVGLLLLLQSVRTQMSAGRKSRRDAGKPNIWLVAGEAASLALLIACFFADLMWEKVFWLTWIMLGLATQLYNTRLQNMKQGKRP